MRMHALTATAAAALLLAGAAPASAAPPFAEPLEVHCSDGGHYEIWTNGSGTFTPGNVIGSTQVLVPVSFSDNRFTVVTPDGETVTMEDPTVESKGKGKVMDNIRRELLYCTFSETFELEQDEMGFPAGSVVTFEGAVTAFLTGR